MHEAAMRRSGQAPHGLGDGATAFAIGDEDGRRVGAIGGFQQAAAEAVGNVLHGTVYEVRAIGRDQDRGSLEHARAVLRARRAAVRAARLLPVKILAAVAAIHPATTLGSL